MQHIYSCYFLLDSLVCLFLAFVENYGIVIKKKDLLVTCYADSKDKFISLLKNLQDLIYFNDEGLSKLLSKSPVNK